MTSTGSGAICRDNFVGGRWSAARSGATSDVHNPATGEVIARVASSDPSDVDRAVAAARDAFGGWRNLTPRARSELLHRVGDHLEADLDEMSRLERENTGKPAAMLQFEMESLLDTWRFFASAGRFRDGKVTGEYVSGYTSFIRRDPLGVVGAITPWNYPLTMAVWKIGPALAAGNTIVLKPSELTPGTSLRLAELVGDVLPSGVVNVVCGDGPVAGAALVTHPDVTLVSLTGSIEAGVAVARAAASSVTRVHLELGGNAPVVVLDDADVEHLVATLRGASFYNAGQDCAAPCRVIASREVHDRVVNNLTDAVASIRTGDPASPDSEMGPLISAAHRGRVDAFVAAATAGGAEATIGGVSRPGPGFYYEPSVVVGVDQSSDIVQHEVFGPVVTVQEAPDEEAALTLANGVEQGLAASVWTRDPGRAMRAAAKLEFGTVWINDHGAMTSEMPHGGFKRSGYGKDLSAYALEPYSDIKHVMARH